MTKPKKAKEVKKVVKPVPCYTVAELLRELKKYPLGMSVIIGYDDGVLPVVTRHVSTMNPKGIDKLNLEEVDRDEFDNDDGV